MKGSQIKAAPFRFRASASVDPAHRQTLLLSGSGERETGYIRRKSGAQGRNTLLLQYQNLMPKWDPK
jgi:hypothetical protein